MRDIMALQDPRDPGPQPAGPKRVRGDHRAHPGAVDQRRPDRRRQRRPSHRVDDPGCPLRGDVRLWALAAVRGRQDVQPPAHRLPAGALTVEGGPGCGRRRRRSSARAPSA